MNTASMMSADASHVAVWILLALAGIVFSIVLRDLLMMHVEREAREKEEQRLRAQTDDAED